MINILDKSTLSSILPYLQNNGGKLVISVKDSFMFRVILDYINEHKDLISCPFSTNESDLYRSNIFILLIDNYKNIKLPGDYTVVIIEQIKESEYEFNDSIDFYTVNNQMYELYSNILNNQVVVYNNEDCYDYFKDFLKSTATKFTEVDTVDLLLNLDGSEVNDILLLKFYITTDDMGIELLSNLKRSILSGKILVVSDSVLYYILNNLSKFDMELNIIRIPYEEKESL